MYSAQPNGAEGATINPAALNSADLNRGIKRSRSPESYRDTLQTGPADDDKPRKRGRPMKGRSGGSLDEPPGQAPIPTPAPPSAPTSASAPAPAPASASAPAPQAMPPQTPQSASMPLPLQSPQQYAPPPATPSQASPPPPKPTPKSTLKALPTVRDHTTDQLAPGGDEYLPRETDEAGEKKVMPNGQLLGGREYRCRTFLVQNRGEKLFMLATECARVLGYRDSYLLFNKNRSLYKIIANQVEKDDLVNQEVLPFSYRSRQIAIVTARSMFRQFGSRVINHGRRVRDDYWEAKARKQGFTENDLAGEKRPGAAKAREAAMEASQNTPILGAPHGEIVYSNTPGQFGGAPQAPLVQPDYNDTRTRDYSNILKAPRQEITGPAYQDRTQPAPIPELHAQAHHAAEFNRGINHQREMRGEYLQGMWRRPHEQPVQSQPSLAQPIGATADSSAASGTPAGGRAGQHPGQHHSSAPPGGLPQAPSQPPAPGVPSGQSPQLMMTAPPYSQPLTSQTQMQPARLGSSGSLQQGAQPYSYPQSSQMWQQAPQTPQYSYSHPSQAHQSPHQPPQQHQQQQPSQPPSQQQQQQQPHSQQSSQPPPPPPSIRQQPGAPGGQVQQGSMPYSGIPGMTQGYTTAASGHGMSYDQTPRQYMHQSPAPAPPPVTQSWSGQAQASQWWPNQPQ